MDNIDRLEEYDPLIMERRNTSMSSPTGLSSLSPPTTTPDGENMRRLSLTSTELTQRLTDPVVEAERDDVFQLDRSVAGDIIRVVLAVVLVLVVIATIVLAAIPSSPVIQFLLDIFESVASLPWWAQLLSLLVSFSVIVPLGCPITLFNLLSGLLFHWWFGLLVATVGGVLSASVCFLLGQTLFKEWVYTLLERKIVFRALLRAVSENHLTATWLIFITHLSPIIPVTVLNYVFSVSTVSFPVYLFATMCGVSPGMVVYVYVGSQARDLMQAWRSVSHTSRMWQMVWIGVIVCTSVVIIAFITLLLKIKLRRIIKELEDEEKEAKEESEGFRGVP